MGVEVMLLSGERKLNGHRCSLAGLGFDAQRSPVQFDLGFDQRQTQSRSGVRPNPASIRPNFAQRDGDVLGPPADAIVLDRDRDPAVIVDHRLGENLSACGGEFDRVSQKIDDHLLEMVSAAGGLSASFAKRACSAKDHSIVSTSHPKHLSECSH